MTSSPHSRTTTELAAEVEAGNRETPGWCVRCGHADVCHDKGGACSFPSGCDCPAMLTTEEVSAALAELRSRAEQHDEAREACEKAVRGPWYRSFKEAEKDAAWIDKGRDEAEARAVAAERERDHMRAALERIVSAYSDENEEFLADTVFTTALDALSQPGNTQP